MVCFKQSYKVCNPVTLGSATVNSACTDHVA